MAAVVSVATTSVPAPRSAAPRAAAREAASAPGKESGEPDHAGNSGGASVWWTWTAPAAESVTFDTRGSNFDTLLAVYAGNSLGSLVEVASNDDASDGTLQSAVHFSAQQGQTYHLAVDGYGGKSGTVVLNWQASSSGAGRSGDDDFSLRVSLSGTSGRSEGSNVDAGIQSGEPNHAGNSGGASVWWTWTAPTTESVTFNTRGSDFDTLLAVYTGYSLGNLVEVVSNDDDAEGGTLQSAVRISAQQGQTYHIAVDGYGGATGAIVLNWQMASAALSLRVAGFETPEPGKPSYVIAGQNASLQYWKTPDGGVSQMLYTSADGTESARVFYDEATGLPRQVLDEVSGHWMLIQENGLYGVDFWLYDGDGAYQGGFAVFEESGQFYVADIVGLPVHAGRQITGQLHPDSASWSGSFTLEVGADDLENIQPVPPEIAALMDSLAPPETERTGAVSNGSRTRRAAIQGPTRFVSLLGDMAAFFTPGKAAADEEKSASPSMTKLLTLGGAALAATGVVGSSPAVRFAGAGLVLGTFIVGLADIVNTMRTRVCGESETIEDDDIQKFGKDFCHATLDLLARKDERGLTGFVRDMVDSVTDKVDKWRGRVKRGKEALKNVVSGLSALLTQSEHPPASAILPRPPAAPCRGRQGETAASRRWKAPFPRTAALPSRARG